MPASRNVLPNIWKTFPFIRKVFYLFSGILREILPFGGCHGTDPVSSGLTNYHYGIIPHIAADEMPAYVADMINRVEIVAARTMKRAD